MVVFYCWGLGVHWSLGSAGGAQGDVRQMVECCIGSMVWTLEAWNLFGGFVGETSPGVMSNFSPLGFFRSLQSAGISHSYLLKKVAGFLRFMFFARCKHGTCSDEVWWSLWMVGRSRQLDEGAGRQKWKCHDPLNCAIVAASCAVLHIM